MEVVIGIDPGKTGAITTLSLYREVVRIDPIPADKGTKGVESYDIFKLIEILKDIKNEHDIKRAYIEKQQIFASQGAVSGGSTMYGYGMLVSACCALEIPFQKISPKTWNKVIFKGLTIPNTPKAKKELSVKTALSLYPSEKQKMIRPRGRVVDHNMAESLLIAEYGVSLLCQQ